ncbi:g protein-coupled receptor-related [Anaeramoeba ignava]|uniref:G protein-coupled receptor-related n=1 Tax=Anaeramoeba ignava TaxID=1746090 RepID=A0A9Q0L7V6_ANAIG|nr:g protein-coupled receptor-related [Anaeramoeba ignava]
MKLINFSFLIYFLAILFLIYKTNCAELPLPTNYEEIESNNTYYFVPGNTYSNYSTVNEQENINITCQEPLNEPTTFTGLIQFNLVNNTRINTSNCGSNLTFSAQVIVHTSNPVIFDHVNFSGKAQISSTSSFCYLYNCDISGVTRSVEEKFILSQDSSFLIESLISSNDNSFQNFDFSLSINPPKNITINNCDGNFNLIVDGISTYLSECVPLALTIKDTDVTITNGDLKMKNLTLYEDSSIFGDVLNVNESISIYGDASNSKIISASLYFNGTNFFSEDTKVEIQNNFSIFSSSCNFQTSDLFLIVNNTTLEINDSLTIRRIDFINSASLHGSATLQVSDNIFFNSSDTKTIASPLKVLNLNNNETTDNGLIHIYDQFFISTSLPSVHLPSILFQNSEVNLELYSQNGSTNYTMTILRTDRGTIIGNNTNFLVVTSQTTFNSDSILNNITIDSQNTKFTGNGSIEFQNSAQFYTSLANSEPGSLFTLFGNGSFIPDELIINGSLFFDGIFQGKNIQITANGKLEFSNVDSSVFNKTNITLNGYLTIRNSIIYDPLTNFSCDSENEYPLSIIDASLIFLENQPFLPSMKMENSNITHFNSTLKGLFLEGYNILNASNLTFQNGQIQAKENSESFLDFVSFSTVFFGSSSGFNLNSNSILTIFSSDNSTPYLFSSWTNNVFCYIVNDSSLKLQNLSFEMNANFIVDSSSNILVNQSFFKINSSNEDFIGTLYIVGFYSEVELESYFILKNLNISQGKFTFTTIRANETDSSLIFGDGTSNEVIINENTIEQSIIQSQGYIEINNNTIIHNIKFEMRDSSHLVIKTFNITDTKSSSKIENQGLITVFQNEPSLINEKKQGYNLNEEFDGIFFNFSLDNQQNGTLNFSDNIQFNQEFSCSGLFESANNMNFEKGLMLYGTGKIQGLRDTGINISVNGNLNISESTTMDLVNISVNGEMRVSGLEASKNISNSLVTVKSFFCYSNAHFGLYNSTLKVEEDYYFEDSCYLVSDSFSISGFHNYGNFSVESKNNISFDANFYNYGNFVASASNILFRKLVSYEGFQLNNSTLILLQDSVLNNSNAGIGSDFIYLTNSSFTIQNESTLTFYGNYIIEKGMKIDGNFEISENTNMNLRVESTNTELKINKPPIFNNNLTVELLRDSQNTPRTDPYNVIYLLSPFNFSLENLQTNEDQSTKFSQNGDWVIGNVQGCRKGKYSNSFDQPCQNCSEGWYNDEIGVFSCKKCPVGHFSDKEGQEECEGCSPGLFQPNEGETTCLECEKGTYSSGFNSTICTQCPLGQYNSEKGSSGCYICEAGKFSHNPTRCESCWPGVYSSKNASSKCDNCPLGKYNTQPESTSCSPCEVNTYQDESGQTSCHLCPTNSETNIYGASSIDDCLCSIGYYGLARETCKICSKGSVCDDVGIVNPAAEEGYWHSSSDPTTFLECSVKEACPGGGTDNCNKELGYSGSLCSVCLQGFYKFGNQCMKCPNNQKNRLVLVGIFVILLCLFLFIIARKVKNYFASFSITFSFFQILAVISGLKLNWPDSIGSTWRSISLFNFNIDYLAVECNLQLTYTQKWALCMVFPFILLLVLLVVYFFVFLHSKIIGKCGAGFMRKFPRFCSKPSRQTTNKYLYVFSWLRFKISQLFTHGFSKEQRKSLYNNLINSYTTILSFIYLFLSYKVLQIFDCKKQSEGTYTFGGDSSLFCYEKWWKDIFPFAIVFLVLYVVGIPLILSILFFVSSKKLDEQSFDLRFGLLCTRYTKTWFFWEIFVMIRKLLLTIAQLFLSFDPIIQSIFCVVVLLFALVLQIQAKPFIADRHNTLEFVLICFSEIILFSGMVFASNDFQQTSGKGILGIFIITLIWISFSTLIIMILFEIRHRVRVHKGKDIDEIQQSIDISSGQTILKFLASKPSFFLIWDWFLESSEYQNKIQREFFQQIRDYYNSKEIEKQKLKFDTFWESILIKWRDSFHLIIKSWFIQASLKEKIQFINLLSKIRFEGLLYCNSNYTKKDQKKTKTLTTKYFKQNQDQKQNQNQNQNQN